MFWTKADTDYEEAEKKRQAEVKRIEPDLLYIWEWDVGEQVEQIQSMEARLCPFNKQNCTVECAAFDMGGINDQSTSSEVVGPGGS